MKHASGMDNRTSQQYGTAGASPDGSGLLFRRPLTDIVTGAVLQSGHVKDDTLRRFHDCFGEGAARVDPVPVQAEITIPAVYPVDLHPVHIPPGSLCQSLSACRARRQARLCRAAARSATASSPMCMALSRSCTSSSRPPAAFLQLCQRC